MSSAARDLIRRIDAIGGRLFVEGAGLRYKGPLPPFTPELRAEVARLKGDLMKVIGCPLVAGLVARLADCGVWPEREGESVALCAHEGNAGVVLPRHLLAEAESRVGELSEWLDRSPATFTEDEWEILGFARGGPFRADDGRWVPAREVWPEGYSAPAAPVEPARPESPEPARRKRDPKGNASSPQRELW